MTLRFEIFPRDLDTAVDFYVRVLGFRITKDERDDPEAYVAMRRGSVQVGALQREVPRSPADRRPPVGVELVLEVDDVTAERNRVVAAGCWAACGQLMALHGRVADLPRRLGR